MRGSTAAVAGDSVDVCPVCAARRIVHAVPNPLPAAFLRGGTSKGVFVAAAHLPADRAAWAPVFRALMGSPDAAFGRQLNGMGGGVSSLSKVVVVGAPATAEDDVDAEYTFAQIGVRDDVVDYSGNCGNLSSMAGVFAVDAGVCRPRVVDDERSPYDASSPYALGRVRLWNTNTRKRVDTTFPVRRDTLAPVLHLDEAAVAGVSGRGSRIVLDFVRPAGASAPAGTLLPTGLARETIALAGGARASVTLMDCTNPSVLVDTAGSGLAADALDADLDGDAALLALLEDVRREGARRMGLDPAAQAQPKIALVSRGRGRGAGDADVHVRALSMGVAHKAVPMTLGLCVGVAARTPGTVVAQHLGHDADFVAIRHPGGVVEVGARIDGGGDVLSVSVVRTGRRLMHGAVFWD